jgi:hypothetical protein
MAWHRGIPRDAKIPPLVRFWNNVVIQDNGCWFWTGTRKPERQGSYPMFKSNPGPDGTPVHAVHFAYEKIRCRKRPRRGDGKELSHICEGGSKCCNPWHVIVETHKENSARKPRVRVLEVIANARAHKKPVVVPIPGCHPTRSHWAKGLCKKCYDVAKSRKRRERLRQNSLSARRERP